MPKIKHIGDKLKEAIEASAFSQADVARHFKVKPPTVSGDWIKFGRIAKEHIPGLVRYFELPYEWWFDDRDTDNETLRAHFEAMKNPKIKKVALNMVGMTPEQQGDMLKIKPVHQKPTNSGIPKTRPRKNGGKRG